MWVGGCVCTLWARGRMNDESGCLFGRWTVPEGRAKGEKDKIAVLDEREGKLQDLATQRGRSCMGDLKRDGSL